MDLIGAPNYYVLATDYTNYSIIYNCTNNSVLGKQETAWIVTREKTPSTATVDAYEAQFKTLMPTYGGATLPKTLQGTD